jgi:hypothetical protein
MLLTSSLGALAGSGLLFLYPGRIMPLSFTTEVGTCVQIRLLLFRIQKLPYFMEFADHNLVFLIGVSVFSVNTCLVECSGIICNFGI